jgi:hypothetical protein
MRKERTMECFYIDESGYTGFDPLINREQSVRFALRVGAIVRPAMLNGCATMFARTGFGSIYR